MHARRYHEARIVLQELIQWNRGLGTSEDQQDKGNELERAYRFRYSPMQVARRGKSSPALMRKTLHF